VHHDPTSLFEGDAGRTTDELSKNEGPSHPRPCRTSCTALRREVLPRPIQEGDSAHQTADQESYTCPCALGLVTKVN
jgi:hypothetical protein